MKNKWGSHNTSHERGNFSWGIAKVGKKLGHYHPIRGSQIRPHRWRTLLKVWLAFLLSRTDKLHRLSGSHITLAVYVAMRFYASWWTASIVLTHMDSIAPLRFPSVALLGVYIYIWTLGSRSLSCVHHRLSEYHVRYICFPLTHYLPTVAHCVRYSYFSIQLCSPQTDRSLC